MDRNDDLLRGSRKERVAAMKALREEAWSLDTLLETHMGLLDHAEDVRIEAFLSLLAHARRQDGPGEFAPGNMVRQFFLMFTVTSQLRPQTVLMLLAESKTSCHDLAIDLLTWIQSNEEFKRTVEQVSEAGYREALGKVSIDQLSTKKRSILNRVRGDELNTA